MKQSHFIEMRPIDAGQVNPPYGRHPPKFDQGEIFNFMNKLSLVPGETVVSHVDGAIKKDGYFKALYLTIFTMGLYLCFRKREIATAIATNFRFIYFRRVLNSADTVVAYEQISYFLRNLTYGRQYYQQNKTFGCCCQRPLCGLILHFSAYPNAVVDIDKTVKFDKWCRKAKGFARYDITSVEFLIPDPSMAMSGAKTFETHHLVEACISLSGKARTMYGAPQTQNFQILDGQELNNTDDMIIKIDRQSVCLASSELVIDALPCLKQSLLAKIKVFLKSLVTFGIYYVLYRCCLPYLHGALILTDRRVINVTYKTRGRTGPVKPNSMDTEFWLVSTIVKNEIDFSVKPIARVFGFLGCCSKPIATITLGCLEGYVSFAPPVAVARERIMNFIRSLSSAGANQFVDGQPMSKSDVHSDLVLIRGEHAVAAVKGKIVMPVADTILAYLLSVVTLGLYPDFGHIEYYVTTHNFIVITSWRPLLGCVDMRHNQTIYSLKNIASTGLKKEQKFSCCLFGCGSKMVLRAVVMRGANLIDVFELPVSSITSSAEEQCTQVFQYLNMSQGPAAAKLSV